MLGALAASAHASGAAVEDDGLERGEVFLYRVRDCLEQTTQRLQRVSERCAALVSFEVCHHKRFLIYRADSAIQASVSRERVAVQLTVTRESDERE